MLEPRYLSRRSIAAVLPLAALAGASAIAQPAPAADDSTLLDIGRRWEAAYDAMKAHDREYDRLYSTMTQAEETAHEAVAQRLFLEERSLLKIIVATPASTMEGLAIKAEALALEHEVGDRRTEAVEAALRQACDYQTTAALSLALDILKIARAG